MLLLNGSMMTMAAWEPVAAPLGETYRVSAAISAASSSRRGRLHPRLDAHVEDVVALLDSLGLERVHVAGTSFGALVALRLAALHPDG